MKITTPPHLVSLFVATILLSSTGAHAQSGSWSSNVSGIWTDAANWNGGLIADGAGNTATFSANITANRVVTNNTDRTIGHLSFADTASTYYRWTVSGPGLLSLDADGTGGGTSTVTVASNSMATIGGNALVLAGSNTLQKTGAGILTLTGTNTFSGTIIVQEGSLLAGSDAANVVAGAFGLSSRAIVLGNTSGTATVSLSPGLGSVNQTIGRDIVIRGGNTGSVSLTAPASSAARTHVYSGAITLGSEGVGHPLTVNAATWQDYQTWVEFRGPVRDPEGLQGSVTGRVSVTGVNNNVGDAWRSGVVLSGSNTFSGGVTLYGGTLSLGSATALGTGPLVISNANAKLTTTGSGVIQSNNNPLVLHTTFNLAGNSLDLGTGTVTLTGSRLIYNFGDSGAERTLTLGGIITDGGQGYKLTYSGGYWGNSYKHALLLSGLNTFSGGLLIDNIGSAGVFKIGNLGIDASASAVGTGPVTFNPDTYWGSAARFDNRSGADGTLMTENAFIINAPITFVGSYSLNLGRGSVSLGTASGTSRTITVEAKTLTVGGCISDGTTARSLVKAGAGTLRLTGTNLYSQGTFINAGTLQVENAGCLGTGNVTVQNTGCLNFQSPQAIADTATLTVSGTASVNLDIGIEEVVASLVLRGTTNTSPGSYGGSDSPAHNKITDGSLSGLGIFRILPDFRGTAIQIR